MARLIQTVRTVGPSALTGLALWTVWTFYALGNLHAAI